MITNQAEPVMAGTQSTTFTNDQLLQALGNRMFQDFEGGADNFKIILSTDHEAIEDNYKNIQYVMLFNNETFDVDEIIECWMQEWGYCKEYVVIPEYARSSYYQQDPDGLENCFWLNLADEDDDGQYGFWITGTGVWDEEMPGDFSFIDEDENIEEPTEYNQVFMLLARTGE